MVRPFHLLCTVSLLALAGCGSSGKSTADADPPLTPPVKSAAAPAVARPAADDLDQAAEQYAAKVQRAQAGATARQADAAPQIQWITANPNLRHVDPAAPLATVAKTEPAPAPAPVVAPEKKPEPRPADPATLSNDQLITALRQRLDKAPASVKPALAAAALAVLDPKYQLTEDELAPLTAEDRALVLAYQRAFAQIGSALTGDTAENRAALQKTAEQLAAQIAATRKLRISHASLCTRVNGFGQYTPFESTSFLAGREHPVIVYAELDHFVSTLDSVDGQHTVKLRQEVVLYNDADGLAVWRVKPTDIIDKSRNRRRDFFVVQIVNLPARLTVGKYLLKLTIHDEQGQAVDEATLPVQIVADSKIAGK